MSYKRISPTPIIEGGTNASSLANSDGVIYYDGTKLSTTAGLALSSGGITTNTKQPAFFAQLTSIQSSVTGDGTEYQVPFDAIIFDQDSNFASNQFTAPVTGIYLFQVQIAVQNVNATHTTGLAFINTTAFGDINIFDMSPIKICDSNNNFIIQGSYLTKMTAADVAKVNLQVYFTNKTINVFGSATSGTGTFFSGYLVC